MKAIYPLTLISIFALCTFFSGCASTDSPSKTTATKKNNQAVVVNNNTVRTIETPSTTPTAPTMPAQQNASLPAAKTTSTKMPNDPPVTMASFDQLKIGMTHKEVAKILGSPGTTSGALKTQTGNMAMYSWKGKGENGEWNVTARFDNGKLANKVQVGLK
jgi:outer membrane protein assembly factor BamE (lipoprotein component of BamABCDE complex)